MIQTYFLRELTKSDIKVTENLFVLMQDRAYPYGTVSERRHYLSTKFGRIIYNCHPTKDALLPYRAILQSGICSCLTILREPIINVKECSWSIDNITKGPLNR